MMKISLLILVSFFSFTDCQRHCGAACQSTGGICVDDGKGSMYCSCSSGFVNTPGDRTTCVASSTLTTSGCRFVGCGSNADCKLNAATGKHQCVCREGFEKDDNNARCVRKVVRPQFTGCKYIGCGDARYGRCILTRGGSYQCLCYSNARLDFVTQKCVPKPVNIFESMWPWMLFLGDGFGFS